jgi:hypothetical protein
MDMVAHVYHPREGRKFKKGGSLARLV